MTCPEHYRRGLILIPTPLQETLPLESVALSVLQDAAKDPSTLILVEELKVGRIRWLKWGLPRESIERFVAFNEHTESESFTQMVAKLKNGARAVLMSDGGLPAFCDPGMKLVDACHLAKVRVTATPFPNSIALSLALSGFEHREFHFAGFLPAASDERKRALDQLHQKQKTTLILMDTPYRLGALLQDLAGSAFKNRRIFLASELNSEKETLFRGKPADIIRTAQGLNKVEFVIVVEGSS